MHRRNMLQGAASAIAGLFAAASARAATEAPGQAKLKVVYHLSDLEKVSFVTGNIQNHFDGVGGPDHVTIALVVHGPALKAFHATGTSPDLARHVGQFFQGRPRACRLRRHMRAAECDAERPAAGFCQRRQRRGGAPGRAAIARLSLFAALNAYPIPRSRHEIVPQWPLRRPDSNGSKRRERRYPFLIFLCADISRT